jgi:hypothetical protein
MAGHSNAKTTGLYDRRNDDVSVGASRKDWDLNARFGKQNTGAFRRFPHPPD